METEENKSELLTESAAAKHIGVSGETMRKFRDAGLIEYLRLGRKIVRYRPAQLDDFLNQSASRGKAVV
jgi:predicted site-specific integrase-resolvase